MPLTLPILQMFPNRVFVETGLDKGQGIRLARAAGFDEIHSVELNPDLVAAVKTWSDFQELDNVHIYTGDSGAILPGIVQQLDLPVTFWLDAHPCIEPMELDQCPLLAELEAITRYCRHPSVILIDDMRVFSIQGRERILAALERIPWPQSVTYVSTPCGIGDILASLPV